MSNTIPNTYFFEFTLQSPKRTEPITIDGDLEEWNEIHRVPDLMHLRHAKPFAKVYFTWDDQNIYIAFGVTGKKKAVEVDARRFWRRDCMELWLDLRNDKPEGHYTEHCHHLFLLPKGRKEDKELATVGMTPESGSTINDQIFDHKEIEVASQIQPGRYSVEARIPVSAIPTYDPVHHPVIGFNYHINDVDRRSQWWACGPDFARHRDPSTWGTIGLISES